MMTLIIFVVIIVIGVSIVYFLLQDHTESYSKTPVNDEKINEILQRLRPMLTKSSGPFSPPLEALNNREILDEVIINPSTKSYVVSKKNIYLCLRNKNNNNEYYDIDTLIHKTLHEIAHCLCPNPEPNHEGPFYDIFYSLIDRAKVYNVYAGDYEPPITDYC